MKITSVDIIKAFKTPSVAAEVAVGEVLRWGELSLRVRSVRPHAVGGAVLFWWAALEQEAT